MTTHLIALSVLIGTVAACLAMLTWRRRQHRRLLNDRETAHLLRQAQYLQQLAQTTYHCGLNPKIPSVLLRLAEETLATVSASGQPDAQAAVSVIRKLNEQLENGGGADSGGDPETQTPVIQRLLTGAEERDYARVRLHLTDTSRLLHRAFRKGYIDRSQHQQMTDELRKSRLHTDIEHMLRRETEARSAGDHARARACLSQARGRLDSHEASPRLRSLLADIDRRLAELDREASIAPPVQKTMASKPMVSKPLVSTTPVQKTSVQKNQIQKTKDG